MQQRERILRDSELGVPATALREEPRFDAMRVSVPTILLNSDAIESGLPLIGSHFLLTSGQPIGFAGAALVRVDTPLRLRLAGNVFTQSAKQPCGKAIMRLHPALNDVVREAPDGLDALRMLRDVIHNAGELLPSVLEMLPSLPTFTLSNEE